MRPIGIPDEWLDTRALKIALVLCALLATAVRLFLLIVYAHPTNPYLWEFGVVARNLATTGTYALFAPSVPSAYMPPGYPVLIYLFYRVFGIGPVAHVALSAVVFLLELAIPFLVWRIAAHLWDRTTGLVAFLLALFWPHFLLLAGRLNSVSLYVPILIAACGVLFLPRLSLPAKAAICGITLGLYATMRWEAAVYLVPFGYWFLRQSATPARRRLLALALLAATFAVPIVPWLVRNYYVYDRFVLSTQGWRNVVRGHHANATGTARDPWPAGAQAFDEGESAGGTPLPGVELPTNEKHALPMDEIAVDSIHRREALSYIASHPRHEVILALRKFFYFNVADFTHPVDRLWPIWLPSFAALVIGLVFWLRTGTRNLDQQLLWAIYGLQMIIAMAFHVVPRYRMTVVFVPVLFLAAWIASRALPALVTLRDKRAAGTSSQP